jgi:hypothetical protein
MRRRAALAASSQQAARPGAEEAHSVDITLLSVPVADVGPLPPDLLAAFNGASELTTNALFAARMIAGVGTLAFDREMAVAFLKAGLRDHNPARGAILAVANELADARRRRGPARFGAIVRATAHEVSLALSLEIDCRIRRAVTVASAAIHAKDEAGLRRFLLSNVEPMDLEFLSSHFPHLRQHFDASGLPDPEAVQGEIRLEASAAANARELGGRLRNNLDVMHERYAAMFGNKEEKKARALSAFERIRADQPKLKLTEVQKLAGREAGVSARQVRTYLREIRGSL